MPTDDGAITEGASAGSDAAAILRAEIRSLAHALVTGPLDRAALVEAASLVREARRHVTATDVRPTSAPHGGRDEHRRRSMFGGDLNAVASELTWRTEPGPTGETGLAFGVTVSVLHQGPPGAVHGGYLAGLFDELLGRVQAVGGSPGYTGRLVVRYRRHAPLDTPLDFHGWLEHDRGRRITTRGVCRLESGVPCAEAEALFVRPATGADAAAAGQDGPMSRPPR